MGGNSHIKETQAAKRFANEIGIYGIRFLCFYKDWCVFGTTLPPGLLADMAWPPVYIIVKKDLSVRWSKDEEGIEIFEYLKSINSSKLF